jgi:hypothetical protein
VPEWNFTATPQVTDRHPLWAGPLPEAEAGPDAMLAARGARGALDRLMPVSAGLSTAPEGVARIPGPSYAPVLVAAALALFFIGLLVDAGLVIVVGVAGTLAALARWTWRTEGELR